MGPGTKISLKQAREYALSVLLNAEKERSDFAEREAKIGTIYADPNPLEWTRELPKEPGFYWHCYGHCEAAVVRINPSLWVDDPDYCDEYGKYRRPHITEYNKTPGWWLGPIEVPPPSPGPQ